MRKKNRKRVELIDLWIVQAFQHGEIDGCEAESAYETEAEAMKAAKDWAEDVAYEGYEHEAVVFKAVATFRGKTKATRFDVVARQPPRNPKGDLYDA